MHPWIHTERTCRSLSDHHEFWANTWSDVVVLWNDTHLNYMFTPSKWWAPNLETDSMRSFRRPRPRRDLPDLLWCVNFLRVFYLLKRKTHRPYHHVVKRVKKVRTCCHREVQANSATSQPVKSTSSLYKCRTLSRLRSWKTRGCCPYDVLENRWWEIQGCWCSIISG